MSINPWEVPPFPEHGSGEEELYAAIGRALTAWELFDSSFASLFAVLVGEKERLNTAAARAYGTITTFRGRVDMVQGAAQVYFAENNAPVEERRCKELAKDAERLSPRRNEIAHGMAMEYALVVIGKSAKEFVLTANYYGSNKRGMKNTIGIISQIGDPKYIYSVPELAALRREFMKLAERGIKLGNDIRDGLTRPDDEYIPQ